MTLRAGDYIIRLGLYGRARFVRGPIDYANGGWVGVHGEWHVQRHTVIRTLPTFAGPVPMEEFQHEP